jgi:NitT/TauT family transport system ATP-binding protein
MTATISSTDYEVDDRGSIVDIDISDVGHAFGEVRVLDGVCLHIPAGSSISIVGPSGCGKSTLLRMVAGLIQPSEGRIAVGPADTPKGRLRHCAMMPQQDLLLPWRTALDNACLALENRGVPRREARKRAQPLFHKFGLAAFESSLPAQLSGGMRQRVSFLRTLMAEKAILLLDEPFGALDAITRAEMQDWLIEALRYVPRSSVLVTHDVDEAILLGDTVAVMSPRPSRIVALLKADVDKSQRRLDLVSSADYTRIKHDILKALGWH